MSTRTSGKMGTNVDGQGGSQTMDETAEKAFTPGSLDWVRQQAHRSLNSNINDEFIFVHEVFSDKVIAEREMADELLEIPYSVEDNELVFGEPTEVTVEYVAKMQQPTRGGELTGPFVYKDEARQIAYAAVLVPGEEDSDGEAVTAGKIEEVAHGWMESYRNIDLQHSLNDADAVPVESYITPSAMTVKMDGRMTTIPKGSWVLAGKFRDEEMWDKVNKGELGGWSVMGVPRAAMKSADTIEAAGKRTLLRDLGEDWIATHVSVVDNPAVPKAKWFALKSSDEQKPSVSDKLWGWFTGSEDVSAKEGKVLSARNMSRLEEMKKLLDTIVNEASNSKKSTPNDQEVDVDAEEIKAAVDGAVKEAIEPLTERLDVLEDSRASDDGDDSGNTEGEASVKESSTNDDAGTDDSNDDDRITALEQELAAEKAAREELEGEVEERLKSFKRGSSKAIVGQDGEKDNDDSATKGKPSRDAFGRRLARR